MFDLQVLGQRPELGLGALCVRLLPGLVQLATDESALRLGQVVKDVRRMENNVASAGGLDEALREGGAWLSDSAGEDLCQDAALAEVEEEIEDEETAVDRRSA